MKKFFFNKELFFGIIVILIISFVIVSPQLYKRSIILGSDVMFHFNRFFEVSKQIETGRFNYFQALYGFNSSGRIINAFYGWDFAFIMGLLLSIVKTWTKFQIVSSFACTFTAGISMYLLTRYTKISNRISILASILYMSSAVVAFYPIAQAFNSWGAAFLPLLFIPTIKAIRNKKNPISIIGLATVVSVLVSVHMMTLVIGLAAIAPFYLYSFAKSHTKLQWIAQMFLSVGLAIMLSANSLLGFLDPYLSNNILKPFYLKQMSGSIVKFLPVRNDLYNIGLVYIIIFIFAISVTVLNWKKSLIEEKFFVVVGGTFLLLSSGLLPWDDLPRVFPFLKTFQFPHRFDIVAYVLLILAFSLIIEKITINKTMEYKTIVYSLIMVLCFISVLNINTFMSSQSWLWQGDDPTSGGNNKTSLREKDPDLLRKAFKDSDLTKGLNAIIKGTPDYLPISDNSNNDLIYSDNPYKKYEVQFVDNPLKIKRRITIDAEIELNWNSMDNAEVQLPVVVYSHSIINLNGKNFSGNEVNKSELGALIVKSKVGKNKVIVGYDPIVDIRVAFVLKTIGIIIIFVVLFRNRKNSKSIRLVK